MVAPTRSVTQPRGCTNFKLRQITRMISRRYDAAVAAAGLKTTQYSLLSHIGAMEPVRPSDLAARMNLEVSTLSRNLQPLIAQGWAELGPGPNARTRLVTLTDAGRAKRAEAQRLWKQAQTNLNEVLGEARVVQLHQLIDESLALLGPDGETDDE
ncbi:MarR family winged helix-turn-helix transcriptional regulator [Piscinibacter sp. HJYY11]|uniref:MarR family winged helix-turn-helix transcriptional regulator n=1 Tax=Piscinibacter sp. HJYY11 TaxID=2801333 RepID=UPI00191D3DD3|nr:MarR family winged helix-turn-helix transcriptional regulator [Piscinibacter sp. HJYY11]MBL0730528.1 winged helix-turn-helix transcriptional regulator [Piscinibacter sp. HJYY11]